jgi:hypothetical protein
VVVAVFMAGSKRGVWLSMRRRIEHRIALVHHFLVHNLATGEIVGYLFNITTKGAMLFSARPPVADDLFIATPRQAARGHLNKVQHS